MFSAAARRSTSRSTTEPEPEPEAEADAGPKAGVGAGHKGFGGSAQAAESAPRPAVVEDMPCLITSGFAAIAHVSRHGCWRMAMQAMYCSEERIGKPNGPSAVEPPLRQESARQAKPSTCVIDARSNVFFGPLIIAHNPQFQRQLWSISETL